MMISRDQHGELYMWYPAEYLRGLCFAVRYMSVSGIREVDAIAVRRVRFGT